MNKIVRSVLNMAIIAATTCTSMYLVAEDKVETLAKGELATVIANTSNLLKSDYVFPEIANKMAKQIQSNIRAGKYDQISQPQLLAQQLTEELQAISHDKHLRVMYSPQMVQDIEQRDAMGNGQAETQAYIKRLQQTNFGFKKQELLDGNVGYLRFDQFVDTSMAKDTANAVMSYFSHADALIIDLRENGGGSPSMIRLLSSYLFGDERVHLNTFYNRPADQYTKSWTSPDVPGKRRPDMDVYVLTSSYTFSAAEEFTYNLKNLKRATIIGETTGGGAHPGGTQAITDRFLVWVPTGRAINPITNTNWAGVGVTPDIEVANEKALKTAHKIALEKLIAKNSDDSFLYQWHLDNINAQIEPVVIDKKLLADYQGKFGARNLTAKEGQLYYHRDGNKPQQLVALTNDTFMIPAVNDFRLKIIKEAGKVVALKGLYDNGRTDLSPKIN